MMSGNIVAISFSSIFDSSIYFAEIKDIKGEEKFLENGIQTFHFAFIISKTFDHFISLFQN